VILVCRVEIDESELFDSGRFLKDDQIEISFCSVNVFVFFVNVWMFTGKEDFCDRFIFFEKEGLSFSVPNGWYQD
jgi:hypothetical protein